MNTVAAKTAPVIIWIVAFFMGFCDIPVAASTYFKHSYKHPKAGASYIDLYQAIMNASTTHTLPKSTQAPIVFQTKPKAFESTDELNGSDDPFYLMEELRTLQNIDVELLEQETDWCLISYYYKLYWVQLFRLCCTLVVFVFLVICYGRIYRELKRSNDPASRPRSQSYSNSHSMTLRRRASVASTSSSSHSGTVSSRRSSKKFIMTTVLLLSAFAICWIPLIIFEIVNTPELKENAVSVSFKAMPHKHHVLQHLFNSIFLMYPLLDAIICVTRVVLVRK